MLYRKSLKFVYSVRQSAKSPIGGNVACFRYTFGIDVDDNVINNLRLISRYFELNGERNSTASIAIDLESMIEDNHVGFTRDELSYMPFTMLHYFSHQVFFYSCVGLPRYEIKALLLLLLYNPRPHSVCTPRTR